jgi:hypothetical protein
MARRAINPNRHAVGPEFAAFAFSPGQSTVVRMAVRLAELDAPVSGQAAESVRRPTFSFADLLQANETARTTTPRSSERSRS